MRSETPVIELESTCVKLPIVATVLVLVLPQMGKLSGQP